MLDALCEDQNAKGDDLYHRIEDLANRGVVPKKLVDLAHYLRKFRNIGGHFELGSLTSNEVPYLDAICSAILQYVYGVPTLLARAKVLLNELESGKSPEAKSESPINAESACEPSQTERIATVRPEGGPKQDAGPTVPSTAPAEKSKPKAEPLESPKASGTSTPIQEASSPIAELPSVSREEAQAYWNSKYGRTLTPEEHREIETNLSGFFGLLAKMKAEQDKVASEADSATNGS